ncbi:hypothetical protein BH09PSE6_BH09PSE6_32810 [soil metagenome]
MASIRHRINLGDTMLGMMFRKTRAGVDAIGRRNDDLPRPLRSLLILVNGMTPTPVLCNHVRALGLEVDAVHDLVQRGYVEPIFSDRAPIGVETGAFATLADSRDYGDHLRSLAIARAYVTSYMRDFTNDDTDSFEQLFRQAGNEAELLALVENCAQVIADVAGIEAAGRFTHRTCSLLPSATF